MNKAILLGRLTRDPELRSTSGNISVCNFTVAVDRRYKNQQGEREADFISCVAWRQQAEFVARYFQKGSRIALVGTIQTRTWDDQDGRRHYVTEVVADEINFVDYKSQSPAQSQYGGVSADYEPKRQTLFPTETDVSANGVRRLPNGG